MRRTKKWIALVLAMLMLVTAMTGCARRGGDRNVNKNVSNRHNETQPQQQNGGGLNLGGLGDLGKNEGSSSGLQDSVNSNTSNNVTDNMNVSGSNIFLHRNPSPREMSATEVSQYSSTRVVKVIRNDGGHGTGFFIDNQGMLITNFHVVEGASSLSIQFDSGATYAINTIVDFNPFYDVAVLKADISGNDFFYFADQYTQGETVYVRGYPKSVQSASFTTGMLSQTSEKMGLMDCVLYDAATNPGNSGGPAMNSRGEVLGVHSFSLRDAEGMHYAIKPSALTQLTMDRNYNINDFREWYQAETGRSYMYYDEASGFGYTYVNTFTAVTEEPCLMSYNSSSNYKDGYAMKYVQYVYEHTEKTKQQYIDYLKSVGFEYYDGTRAVGQEGMYYYHSFEGYFVILEVDTVNNYLYVSCPMYL